MGRLAPPRPISSTRGLDVTAAADHRQQRQRPSQVTGGATPHKGRRPAAPSRTHRDRDEKQRKGFRPTARERRRIADIETREEELAAGHPEFRHVGLLTVTAATIDELDDACAQVEQDAAQSMLDIRPVAARQGEGWVASLPLGRSVRRGVWT